jgi:hypothetical protein
MAKSKTVVIDELHLTLRVPNNLPDDETEVIRQSLAGDDFMNRLRRTVRAAIRVFPELAAVRASLTR